MPFRPRAEHEVWIAEVAATSGQKHEDSLLQDSWLVGTPDLVVEVLSPSNTAQEMEDRAEVSFEGGCRQFWTVSPRKRTVMVSTPDGRSITHRVTGEIDLSEFGAGGLPVSELFPEM